MEKTKLLEIIGLVEKKIEAYFNNYNLTQKQEQQIRDFRDVNKVTLPRKFHPTTEEKYNMSPKEIDEKNIEVVARFKEANEDLDNKVEDFCKSIGYVDFYGEMLVAFEKLPKEFNDLLNEADPEYGLNRANVMNSIIEFARFNLNLKVKYKTSSFKIIYIL